MCTGEIWFDQASASQLLKGIWQSEKDPHSNNSESEGFDCEALSATAKLIRTLGPTIYERRLLGSDCDDV